MMPDIFSSFDPFSFNTFFIFNFVFIIFNVLMIMLAQSQMWTNVNSNYSIKMPLNSTIFMQLSRTLSFNFKGMSLIISFIFLLIIFINLMGLIPYTFSTSSHLIFTLSFGFPVWMSFILSSFFYNPKKSVAHFLPDGAPDWLNPFLVIIESSSIMVRPLTLSFRLAANMSAGHIVLSLIGIYSTSAWFNSMSNTFILSMFSMGYIIFEMAICLIQAYIFCLLLSLYSDDHAH
uniref:ATP synthase F0 subunit 6 n=1 Tax=Drawida ghilarovi TaxID=994964 RepID=UPI0021B6B802|nr:ATP synthase F0 subunit 6 [Drawida ghilarovi]UIX22932.1 ATP synthase F0 subunit 6 [Drawida ghilarovi]UIX22945.1 ATP synthase F0 subunit 6 [Drawida ghilarovi]